MALCRSSIYQSTFFRDGLSTRNRWPRFPAGRRSGRRSASMASCPSRRSSRTPAGVPRAQIRLDKIGQPISWNKDAAGSPIAAATSRPLLLPPARRWPAVRAGPAREGPRAAPARPWARTGRGEADRQGFAGCFGCFLVTGWENAEVMPCAALPSPQ